VGIPSAPRGVPQVEVTFDIDANGILNVSAKDTATGKTQAITITASSGLGKDEVETMVKDAQAHAEEDKRKREMVDLRNQADTLAYSVEKLVNENKDKLDADQVREVEGAVVDARKAVEGENVDALKSAVERLNKVSHAVAEALYKKAGTPPAGEPGATKTESGPSADNVVDAEYTVKN
jgi:molecular chaperone DnaK